MRFTTRYTRNTELIDFKLYLKDFLTAYDFENEIKRIDLQINFKNISKLDCLRQRRNDCGGDQWARGALKDGNEKYLIKLKAKGDRDNLHRKDINNMSFKGMSLLLNRRVSAVRNRYNFICASLRNFFRSKSTIFSCYYIYFKV